MFERRGEQVAWIAGIGGGMVWILFISMFWIYAGNDFVCLLGLALFALGLFLVFFFAPWRFPNTRYFLLLLPSYFVIAAALVLFVFWGWNILETDFPVWAFWFLAPMLLPLILLGNRKWKQL
jgi:hypothetical protein